MQILWDVLLRHLDAVRTFYIEAIFKPKLVEDGYVDLDIFKKYEPERRKILA